MISALLGAAVLAHSFANRACRCLQAWKLRRYRAPDDVEVDSEVLVKEDVLHTREARPIDLRATLGESGRNLFDRLADDFEISDDGVPGSAVRVETLARDAFEIAFDSLRSFQNVVEIEPRCKDSGGCSPGLTGGMLLVRAAGPQRKGPG